MHLCLLFAENDPDLDKYILSDKMNRIPQIASKCTSITAIKYM